ncbi:MAG: tetratricopeptide repeat protein, partial [Myxococcota bacterium]
MSPFGTVCAKCGAGMPMGVKFCGKCGATLEAERPPAKKETPPVLGPGVRALLIVWGLGLLAGLLLGRAFPPAPLAPPEHAAEQGTESGDALLARARTASDSGQFSEAAALYRRAIALAPSNASLLVDLGIAQVALGDDA